METFKKFYTRAVQIISGLFFNGLLILTIVAMTSFVSDVVKGQEPTVFGYKPVYIMTGSMETKDPEKTIDKGSVIITERIDPLVKGEVQVGDVVTYSQIDYKEDAGGNPVGQEVNVTHRVTQVDPENGTFRAKGDANLKGDAFWKDGEMVEDIPLQSIKYKTVKRLNWVANIRGAFANTKMLVLSIVALVSFIVLVKIINSSFYVPQYELAIFKKSTPKEKVDVEDLDEMIEKRALELAQEIVKADDGELSEKLEASSNNHDNNEVISLKREKK